VLTIGFIGTYKSIKNVYGNEIEVNNISVSKK
jgi:hypothetical protein